jgi:ribonuclease D
MTELKIHLHHGDLPETVQFTDSVAVDTEAMGLNPHRDRLCLVQLSAGDGICHLVQVNTEHKIHAPRLTQLLVNPDILKIFHFARFDLAILQHTLQVTIGPVYCTKVASKLSRTFLDRHSLRDLCREMLGIDISKEQQGSDWGNPHLTEEQLKYAATDVLYLHRLKEKLDSLLAREGRLELAQGIFNFLPTCAKLDLLGYMDLNILDH